MAPTQNIFAASVVIVSRNRKEDLLRAIKSCYLQTSPVEIIVIDDGSIDGTSHDVQELFPMVRLYHHETSRGYIVRRNEGACAARTEIIFSIDDDAEFSSPEIVEETLKRFANPAIAAVAIPFVDVHRGPQIKQRAPDPQGVWITNEYIGTAHAVRRDVFLLLGGYREVLFHQGEEGDFCIRLLEAGKHVRLGHSAPIFHYESPYRSRRRIEVFGQRNLMLFAWHNVPFPLLLVHLPATIINGLLWGIRTGCLRDRLAGLWQGLIAIAREWNRRDPVDVRTYSSFRRLKKKGAANVAFTHP